MREARSAGFTLIETLAALAIASVVLLASAALLRGTASTFDRGTRKVDQAEQLMRAWERLASDVASTEYVQRTLREGAVALFAGRSDRLTFLARTASPTGSTKVEAIDLAVEKRGDTRQLIRRRADWGRTPVALDGLDYANPVVLIEGQIEIAFMYGKVESSGAVVWGESWQGLPSLPRLVRLIARDAVSGAEFFPGAALALRADAPASCAAPESDASCMQSGPKRGDNAQKPPSPTPDRM